MAPKYVVQVSQTRTTHWSVEADSQSEAEKKMEAFLLLGAPQNVPGFALAGIPDKLSPPKIGAVQNAEVHRG